MPWRGCGTCSTRARPEAAPVVFHTGQTGVGAGLPGGHGIKLRSSDPMLIDDVAADLPPRLVRATNGLLKRKVLFGSDYPVLTPDRWLKDFAARDAGAGPVGQR